MERQVWPMDKELLDTDRQILEYIYRTFRDEGCWVKSRHLVHDLQALGDAYEVANRIGGELIRIGDPDSKKNALAKLTVKGVAACEGSEQDLLDFVSVLQLFVRTYRASSDGVPRVTADDLIRELGLSELQARKMTMLILEEGGLYRSASCGGTEPTHFDLDRKILRFSDLSSIENYFAICEQHQAKRRAASATSSAAREVSAYDIFISYSHKDEKLADELHDLLEEKGLRCFMSSRDITPGDPWSEAIRNALMNAQELLLLITPNSVRSQWVLGEAYAGWALGKHILPALLKVKPESLPEPIRRRQAKSIDAPESREELAAEIAKRLGK